MDRFARAELGWCWCTDQAAQVGSGCVDLGRARFWVDPDNPQIVVAAEASDLEGLLQLEQVFGQSWADAIASLGPSVVTNEPALAPPPLDQGWAWLAMVKSVEQWSPQPLDESVLVIDLALAWAGCDNRTRAEALLTLTQDTVAALWVSYLLDELPPQATGPLIRAADILRRSANTDPDVLNILTDGREQDNADDSVPADTSLSALDTTPSATANSSPAHEADAATRSQMPVLVDPRLVHPRLLVWRSPTYEVGAETGSGSVLVRAIVSDQVPDDAHELDTLYAVLVDSNTGQQIARGSFSSPDLNGVMTSLVDLDPSWLAGELLVTVADAYLVELGVGLTGAGAISDARRAAERLASWTVERQTRTGPAPSTQQLLAELLLPTGTSNTEDAEVSSAWDSDAVTEEARTALTDDALRKFLIVQEWHITFDVAGAFTRAEDTTPTWIDRHYGGITEDSQCTGGAEFLEGLASGGVHPNITWRYCANPASLVVLAQPLHDGSGDDLELQLWAGSGWTPLVEGEDGYLAAHTRPLNGGQVILRTVRRPL